MTFKELITISSPYSSGLTLNNVISRKRRFLLRYFFLFFATASFAASFIDLGTDAYNTLSDGLFFLSISLFGVMFLLEAFYNSSRFSDPGIDFSLAQILLSTDDMDITAGFVGSGVTKLLFDHLGISKEERDAFLRSERERLLGSSFEIGDDELSFASYAKAIYDEDRSFQNFIAKREVNALDFSGAAEWVKKELEKIEQKERWWSEENLNRVPSLGTSFSYGVAVEVSKYGKFMGNDYLHYNLDISTGYRDKEIKELENAFARSAEANAVIIDNDESIARDIVARFAKKIRLGLAPPFLEHKNILELDWPVLCADKKERGELEEEMFKIFSECLSTGNIILYIPNLPLFIAEAKKIGVNLQSIMEEYLTSPQVHIIGHSIKTDFYYFIEHNPGLGRAFERVVPEPLGVKASMPALLERAKEIEKRYRNKIIFTYSALSEIAELSEKFISYGEMPTKALDLLLEFAPWALKNDIRTVFKNDAAVFMTEKTGIAAGELSQSENDKLSRLEELLHKRIIGQDMAINAVASAMRRSRAGIGNPKRPIASFLFLGPTGVGKTETSKALAESFFGSEERIIRFDMSEYNEALALPRLIGSFSEQRQGNLAAKLRDNPYGVVLLDELEKAAPDVLNLFLRILDEGKFTDAFGSEVSARNTIIIATSNAAADLIWKIVRSEEKIESKKDSIVDYIIENHIFKPELLNRFDDIIIFKPLESKELRSVADKEFEKFRKRLQEEKQIEIKASPELLDYLVLHGSDREFGARSINRIMQEKIEDVVARKILSREVSPGGTLEIGVKDLSR